MNPHTKVLINLTSKIYIQSIANVNKKDINKVLQNVKVKIQGFTKPLRLDPEP